MYIYVNGKIKHSLIVIYFAETTLEGYVHLLSTVKTAKNTTCPRCVIKLNLEGIP